MGDQFRAFAFEISPGRGAIFDSTLDLLHPVDKMLPFCIPRTSSFFQQAHLVQERHDQLLAVGHLGLELGNSRFVWSSLVEEVARLWTALLGAGLHQTPPISRLLLESFDFLAQERYGVNLIFRRAKVLVNRRSRGFHDR